MIQERGDGVRSDVLFDLCFEVPIRNKDSGMLLLWNMELDVTIIGYGCSYIDCIFRI